MAMIGAVIGKGHVKGVGRGTVFQDLDSTTHLHVLARGRIYFVARDRVKFAKAAKK